MTTAIDIYTAPVDVNDRVLPGKVFDEKPQSASKHRPDKDMTIVKDVYVEDGRRKIPRDSSVGEDEEEARRKSEARKSRPSGQKDDGTGTALKTCTSLVDLDDSSLFEEDLNYVEPKKEFPGPYDPERVRMLYAAACSSLKVVPSSRFQHGLNSGRVIAGHQGMGPLGARAVAVSLITNLTVTELHIPNNKLGPEGMSCMARLIHGNEVIKVLDISDNELGREGAKILAAAIKENDSIMQINAAGNKFDDKTGSYFEEALKVNTMIRQLDLSRNLFCQHGAVHIAKGLEENYTVTHLDLSYNHIRRLGIKGIARMLGHNHSIIQLDLSWNGINSDGAKQLGDGLNNNNTLSVLNLTGCRLNAEALLNMLGMMKENRMLKSLQIPHNPLTNADLILFLRAIDSLPDLALDFVDAASITVSQDLLDLEEVVKTKKPGFVVNYRGILGIRDLSRNMLEVMDLMGGDPLEVIIRYTRQKNLRLLDIFARFDVDKSGTMTRQELILGVSDAGIPLSIKQMDKLVAKLDLDGDGEIDFAELLEGYRKFMRDLHRQGKVARNVFKGEMEMFPGLTATKQDSDQVAGPAKGQSGSSGTKAASSRRPSAMASIDAQQEEQKGESNRIRRSSSLTNTHIRRSSVSSQTAIDKPDTGTDSQSDILHRSLSEGDLPSVMPDNPGPVC